MASQSTNPTVELGMDLREELLGLAGKDDGGCLPTPRRSSSSLSTVMDLEDMDNEGAPTSKAEESTAPLDPDPYNSHCLKCGKYLPLSNFVSFVHSNKALTKVGHCFVCRGRQHSPGTNDLAAGQRFLKKYIRNYVAPQVGPHGVVIPDGRTIYVDFTDGDVEQVKKGLVRMVMKKLRRAMVPETDPEVIDALQKCLEETHEQDGSRKSLEAMKREAGQIREERKISSLHRFTAINATANGTPSPETGASSPELPASAIFATPKHRTIVPKTSAPVTPTVESHHDMTELVNYCHISFATLRRALHNSTLATRQIADSATYLMADFSSNIIILASAFTSVVNTLELGRSPENGKTNNVSVLQSLDKISELLNVVEQESTVRVMVESFNLMKYAQKAENMARLLDQSAQLLR